MSISNPLNSAPSTSAQTNATNEQLLEPITTSRRSVATQTMPASSIAPSDISASTTAASIPPSDMAVVADLTTRVVDLTTRLQTHQTMLEDIEIALYQRLDRLEARFGSASSGTRHYRKSDDYMNNGRMLRDLADDPSTSFAKADAQMGAVEGNATRRQGTFEGYVPWGTGSGAEHETLMHEVDSLEHHYSPGIALSEHDEERMDFDEYIHGCLASAEQLHGLGPSTSEVIGEATRDYGLARIGVPLAIDTEILDALSLSPACSMPDLEDAYDATGDALVPNDAVLESLSDGLVDVQLLASIPHPLGIPTPLVDLGTLPLPPSTAEALLQFADPAALAEVTEPMRVSETPHRPGAAEEERRLNEMAAGAYFTRC